MPIGVKQTVPEVAEPVSLDEAKAHLRVDGDYDNSLISALIRSARSYCQRETRRQLMSATYRLTLDHFPGRSWCSANEGLPREKAWEYGRLFRDRSILLPRPPLVSVSNVTYIDAAGQTRTLDPAQYLVDAETEPGRISPAYGATWPDTQDRPSAVQVLYVAGFADASSVPDEIKQAMLLLIGHWYEHRNAVDQSPGGSVPMAVGALLGHHAVPWIF